MRSYVAIDERSRQPSEHHEHHETQHALQRVFEYISPGTNEGISFSLSRITDDLFSDSFPARGDISLFRAIAGETTSDDAVYSLALVLI